MRRNAKTFNIFNTLPISTLLLMKKEGWKFTIKNALIVGAVSPSGWGWNYETC